MAEEGDPSTIRSIAVLPEDAADAFAYSQENPGEAVLRITPPFHGRMRARIHVYRIDDTQMTGAIHISPAELIEDDVLAAYPRLEVEDGLEDGNEDEDRADTNRIQKQHADAVNAWQAQARDAIVDIVTIETEDGPRRVAVKPLG